MPRDPHEGATRTILVGCEIGSVVFVRDYVQLTFEPSLVGDYDGPGAVTHPLFPEGVEWPRLSAYTHPRIQKGGKWLSWDEPGYRDALCACINSKVTGIEILEGERFDLSLGDVTIRISLREEDSPAGEALALDGFHDLSSLVL